MPKESLKVKEGWKGPGRYDAKIEPLLPEEDGLHIDINKKGTYEWWYFDAHLDTGHIIVVFFHASNPNPGVSGKTGIEIVILRPDGNRSQKFFPYNKKQFHASGEKADVNIGKNYIRSDYSQGLPVYEIFVDEPGIGCRLTYKAKVKGWKPGSGISEFGDMGYFAWVVPFARASVEGTITDGRSTFNVNGVGYHDHNWLNFLFPKIIEYWMWGRIYSENYTISYAYIQCDKKMDNHEVKVLMLAKGEDIILSTGEFEFIKENFQYNKIAKHSYPRNVKIEIHDKLKVKLTVKKVIEAVDMLNYFGFFLKSAAKYILRLKPGYFRLVSDFEIAVTQKEQTEVETGNTLHEVVLFRHAE